MRLATFVLMLLTLTVPALVLPAVAAADAPSAPRDPVGDGGPVRGATGPDLKVSCGTILGIIRWCTVEV